MSVAPRLVDGSVAALLAGIASTAPAPGAGAAGAIGLALGIACARKAIAITLTHRPEDAGLVAAGTRLAALAQAAAAGADADAQRFADYIADLRLPHGDRHEAETRDALLAADAAALVSVGERLIAIGEDVERLLTAIETRIAPNMANDIAAARALVAANRAIQSANVAESRPAPR